MDAIRKHLCAFLEAGSGGTAQYTGRSMRDAHRGMNISEAFRRKVEKCFSEIANRLAGCLAEAVERGDLPRDTDPKKMAQLLVNCWEGAALRTRMLRDPAPLREMLDFYFRGATVT
jgi:truncated hemoglobin YjbI